ncbi:Crp/Fnr family transcriptional regulator [Oleidesulfovibrio sp.]|uniref:Crp/Fnr family transcriptional regulator n=1 Tax=Oleidesulfovibrio sp. TaxID=2909707 RepID=UPI003A8BBF37
MNQAKPDNIQDREALFAIEGANKEWMEILDRSVLSKLPKGYELTSISPSDFYLLVSGSLKVSCLAEDGHERVVMIIGAGTLFGEIAHLHLSDLHQHSLRTLEECEVARFPMSLLEDDDFYRTHPHLIKSLVHSLGLKAGAFFAQLFDSGLVEVDGRVCRWLYQLWRKQGKKRVLNPGLSQGDAAAMLGIHRSSLCRVVHSLREQGIIGKFSKKTLEIFQPEGLSDRACSYRHMSD